MELITFILVAYGLTQILVYGSILNTIRPTKGKLGELFHCPMCMGFWVGFFLCVISPFTSLFTFEPNFITPFLLGCLSSGTSYIFCQVFDDEGIKIKWTK
tara:strand:+ start:3584 stop:3883 length:300 start_codon:yes stop_codon:yes gene_type:complete